MAQEPKITAVETTEYSAKDSVAKIITAKDIDPQQLVSVYSERNGSGIDTHVRFLFADLTKTTLAAGEPTKNVQITEANNTHFGYLAQINDEVKGAVLKNGYYIITHHSSADETMIQLHEALTGRISEFKDTETAYLKDGKKGYDAPVMALAAKFDTIVTHTGDGRQSFSLTLPPHKAKEVLGNLVDSIPGDKTKDSERSMLKLELQKSASGHAGNEPVSMNFEVSLRQAELLGHSDRSVLQQVSQGKNR